MAAVGRSLFPFFAPVYVLRGSVDCPLRADSRGIVKVVAATQSIQGYAPVARESPLR
ncbi:hypothetical protein [Brevibacillus sp. SIMBA_040]|uniref:hypothetical protein n=1 Tax=Brevibacillus sp. SIMBA_040 TaxID=3085781 RepID=UPI00397DB480